MNEIALTILEATLTLYLADPSGAPITSNPIWSGVSADYVQISDHWLKAETRPTGAKFPKRHPLVAQYQIDIKRVWALQLSDLIGFRPVRNNYVLDVVWADQDTSNWHRETFYGVTISERSRGSRELNGYAGEFVEDQVFDAQEMVPGFGSGTPPPIDSDLPYTVKYVGLDGTTQNIYTYSPSTQTFTAVGDPTALATLATDSTSFKVTFAGSSAPELEISASGMSATQFRVGAPTSNNVPRVDFYYGTSRVGSVTRWGEVYAQSYYEGVINPQNRTGVYQIFVNASLAGTIEQSRMTAAAYTSFSPASVSGLKLWCAIESLTNWTDGTAIAKWPDLSGNGNDLLQSEPDFQPVFKVVTNDAVSGLPMDGLPGLFFAADGNPHFLQTAGNVLATRQFTIFALVWCEDSSDAGGQLIACSSPTADVSPTDYDFILGITPVIRHSGLNNYRFQEPFGFYQGATGQQNNVQGTVQALPNQWNVVELQVRPDKLMAGTVNGVQSFSATLNGSLATTSGPDDRPIILGAEPQSMVGYVRALLVYNTPPSDADKQKIRKYLGLLYSTPATINIAPVDGSSAVAVPNTGRDVTQ